MVPQEVIIHRDSNGAARLGKLHSCRQLGKFEIASISFRNLTYSVYNSDGDEGLFKKKKDSDRKEILKSINGDFKKGELTAIMGPSGAGKSSLMNVLAGLTNTQLKGSILVNSVERDLGKFRKMSCYIMQKNELCPYLTVMEAMELAANLKLGNDLTFQAKKLLINEILATIGLSHVKSTMISKLSGGETKRMAIALEMVNNPPIMFFDEPTSGLDSSTSTQVLSLLKALASGGRIVICSIHQPSSTFFAMFDQIYLMAEGYCIYSGPRLSLVPFLAGSTGLVCPTDHNPADYAIEVAVGRYGNVLPKLVKANNDLGYYEERSNGKPTGSDEGLNNNHLISQQNHYSDDDTTCRLKSYGASFPTQFGLLFKRGAQCASRDMTLTYVRFGTEIFSAIFLSCIFYGTGNLAAGTIENANIHSMNMINIMFSACMTTVLTFPLEFRMLETEHLNNWYSLKAYYLARSMVDIPLEILHVSLYLVIIYFTTDQPHDPARFFMYLGAGIVISLVAQSTGLIVGLVFNDIEMSYAMGCASLGINVIFSGLAVQMKIAPVWMSWMFYLMYGRYAYHAMFLSIFGFGRENLKCPQAFCLYKSADKILDNFGIEQGSDYWIDIIVLVAYFFVVRLIGYYLLRRKIRSKN